MTTSTSRAAYGPYYELLERALNTERGLRIRVASVGQANQLRVKLHTARALDRDLSRETYELGDPKCGVSVYDNLVVRTKGDDTFGEVIIEPNNVLGEIEEIAS